MTLDFLSGEHIVLVGALLLFVAVMAGKVAYKFGAPALLLFLGFASQTPMQSSATIGRTKSVFFIYRSNSIKMSIIAQI